MCVYVCVHLNPSALQVDNTGMLEFQEFKVFWEKMKKWIVGHPFIYATAPWNTCLRLVNGARFKGPWSVTGHLCF